MTDTAHEVPFLVIPSMQRSLVVVASGLLTATALREAADRGDSVHRSLVMDLATGFLCSIAYPCEFAPEIAGALRKSTDVD